MGTDRLVHANVQPLGDLKERGILNIDRARRGLKRGPLGDAGTLGDSPNGNPGCLDPFSDGGRGNGERAHAADVLHNYEAGNRKLQDVAVAHVGARDDNHLMDKEDLLRRLEEVAAANKLGLTSWPKKAGISESIIINMRRSGSQMLTMQTLERLASCVHMPVHQLINPDAPPIAQASGESGDPVAETLSALTEEIKVLRSAQIEHEKLLNEILHVIGGGKKTKKTG